MKEMKTITFPGDTEPREIVDAVAREQLGACVNTITGVVEENNNIKSVISDIEEDIYVYTPGKNMFPNNATWVNGTFSSSNGSILDPGTGKSNAAVEEYIAVTAEEVWTISWKAKDLNCNMYVVGYDSNKTFLGQIVGGAVMNFVTRSTTFTTPATCAYIRFRIYRNGADYTDLIPEEIQVEKGSVATEYAPNSLVKTPRIDALDTEMKAIKAEIEENNNIKSVISDIEEDIYVYTPGKNMFPNNATWVNGTFSDGNLVEVNTGTNNAAAEDYIAVTAEEVWTISWKAKDLNCSMYVMAYDSDKTFLSQANSGTAMSSVARSITFTTPATCAYIRIRIYRSGAAYTDLIPEEIQVEKGSAATEYVPYSLTKTPRIDTLDVEMETIKAEIEEIHEERDNDQTRVVMVDTNLLGKLEAGYLNNEGVFNTTTSGWHRSDYIPVEPGQFVYFYNINNFNYFGYFDSNKTWIGGKNIETPVVTDAAMLCIHQAPANAKYIIVSLEDTKISTCWGNYTPTVPTGNDVKANLSVIRSYEYFPTNPCDYEGLDVCTFRKGICIGDSITGGGFNYKSGTSPWSDGNAYSYPSQFQKMTGIEMTNEGHSGKTTVQWWDIYGTGGEKAIDFSGYDFAIIHLGINDVSYKVPTADTETAYQNIIDALKSANPGIKIFVCTIIPAYADAIVAETSYGAVNDMIVGLSTQTDVYLCDLTTYGHVYLNSEYAAGHLTAYGYWRMAKDLIGYIGSIMRKYPSDFRFVHFIGTDLQY